MILTNSTIISQAEKKKTQHLSKITAFTEYFLMCPVNERCHSFPWGFNGNRKKKKKKKRTDKKEKEKKGKKKKYKKEKEKKNVILPNIQKSKVIPELYWSCSLSLTHSLVYK